MLLYMGSGAALAAYRRQRRVQGFTECAFACGTAYRLLSGRLEPRESGESRRSVASAIEIARDSQELCSLTALLVDRASDLLPMVLPACAEACRRCAEACDALSPEDTASDCSLCCRGVVEACRAMLDELPSGSAA
jgi:hypothetical protein